MYVLKDISSEKYLVSAHPEYWSKEIQEAMTFRTPTDADFTADMVNLRRDNSNWVRAVYVLLFERASKVLLVS